MWPRRTCCRWPRRWNAGPSILWPKRSWRAPKRQGAARQEATDFEAVTGKGVRGQVGGRAVALGNTAMMQEMGLDTGAAEAKADALRAEGKTAMFIAVDGALAGHRGGGRPDQGQHRAGDQGTPRPRAARHHGDGRQRAHGAGGRGQAGHRRGARGHPARGQEGPDRPVAPRRPQDRHGGRRGERRPRAGRRRCRHRHGHRRRCGDGKRRDHPAWAAT